ncbi:MAG: hypothetical protein KC457_00935 [Myxococcales bacterium]|nr:hypothetical protein [Myxococcales bacterium]
MPPTSSRRFVHPCFTEDELAGEASSGRPTTSYTYSRAAIQAEAGITSRQLAQARALGLLERSIYRVVAFVADRRRDALTAQGIDVGNLILGCQRLHDLSVARGGIRGES